MTFIIVCVIIHKVTKIGGREMILCAECGKKNKDDATVCKHCGYNPGALRNSAAWNYQNANYTSVPYQNMTASCYYDANGKAYNVKYDCVATPVGEETYDEYDDEETDNHQVLLYPYNPAAVQQSAPAQPPKKQSNAMAWVGYILALFIDILAWPFCLIAMVIAEKRGGAKKELCEGGMILTLLRLVTVLVLFLVWWGVSSFWPAFFAEYASWKGGVIKIILFGWPIVVGSIFYQCSAEDSGLEAAGRGYFYFSIAVALVGIFLLDVSKLPIF